MTKRKTRKMNKIVDKNDAKRVAVGSKRKKSSAAIK